LGEEKEREMKELKVVKATWCAPCKQLTPTLNLLETEGHKITYIDADEHKDEVAKLGVRGVPTMIAFTDGVEIGRLSGNKSKEDILGLINS
jgi:thioredoxin-like negative regulator of GroEL